MWSFHFDLIGVVMGLIAWFTIGMIAYRIYKPQSEKLKLGKVLVVVLVGVFSFSIHWNAWDTLIQIPLLPLGVWMLYAVLKRKEGRWKRYRTFAWLGFWSNFIFLASTLLSIPLQHAIYPSDQPSTYLSNVKNASLVPIHPAANDRSLNNELLAEQLNELSRERVMNDQWYEETYMNTESTMKKERFPYQLIDYRPKWGSGVHSMIYIEDDGKGILISTSSKQLYFRSDTSILDGKGGK